MMRLLRRRKPEKVNDSNDFSDWLGAPFAALSEPPSADYRGFYTTECPCGSDWLIICCRFDPETRLPGFYLLDARCGVCGAWITAACPEDGA